MFTQAEVDAAQPNDMPFAVILDDGEDIFLNFFATLSDAEEYFENAPTDSQVYCGRGVDYSLYS